MVKGSRIAALLALLVLVVLITAAPAEAGSVSWTSADGLVTITYNFPDDYSSCTPADTVYTTGLPAGWKAMGQYSFWDMSAGLGVIGTRLSDYYNQTVTGTDLNQQIVYPPTNTWPLIDPVTGQRAIWVKALVVIWDASGNQVAQLGLPGIGKWMVTCTPPPMLSSCTPGYWRNHYESWVGYSPTDNFDATFGVDYFNPDITLADAIWAGGGGLNKLARFGTASLLSAAYPDLGFGLTVAEVLAAVQANDVALLESQFPDGGYICPLD